jgi:hypothetical protein
MVRRLVGMLAVATAGACSVVAGIGDHHLEAPPPAEGGPDAIADPPPIDSGDGDVGADAADAGHPLAIAVGQGEPAMIVGGTNYVYWIDESVDGGPGAIMRGAKNGSDIPVALAPDRTRPIALRALAQVIYWSEDRVEPFTGGIYSIPRFGGAISQLATDDALGFGLLVSGALDLYYESYPPAGGAASVARVSQTAPSGDPACITLPALGRVRALVLDTTGLYFYDDAAHAILVGGIDCNGATTVFAGNQIGVRGIAALGGTVYWITASAVFSLDSAKPNTTPTTVASGFVDLTAIVSWINGIAFVDGAGGTVHVIQGGVARQVASGQGDPRSVFVGTDDVVYWTNHASGEVMRLDL